MTGPFAHHAAAFTAKPEPSPEFTRGLLRAAEIAVGAKPNDCGDDIAAAILDEIDIRAEAFHAVIQTTKAPGQ